MGTTASQKRVKVTKTASAVAKLRESNRTNTCAGAATVDVNKPLTAQQKAFAVAVGQGDSVPNAMARAGFTTATSYGYRMVQMPNIQAAIAAEKEKFEVDNTLTRRAVFEMHKEAFDMAKLMSEPATMVSAAREIGKMAGYYEPVKRELNINVQGNVMLERMNSMSDADLVRLIQQSISTGAPQLLADDSDDSDDTDDEENE
ncbi:hypothetical protein QTI66_32820 [Variovorax sp. J22R133]|uniref:hypothetical protein n=1 Tax=Variovorax brevis TaxID=3053503 RepID=UPI0025765975|nr:hypothetical protein [Variovorax sp. J22R133]MDM0116912.1 hypothetical protein [Variovorax sp. J22R133]